VLRRRLGTYRSHPGPTVMWPLLLAIGALWLRTATAQAVQFTEVGHVLRVVHYIACMHACIGCRIPPFSLSLFSKQSLAAASS